MSAPFPNNPDEPVDLPITPGTTWTDQVGNVWTAYGNLVMSDDSIQNVRQSIVAFLKARHGKWQWYDYPPDNLKTPAVVVVPGEPYITPSGQNANLMAWILELRIVAGRAKPEDALRRIEFFYTEIFQSLLEYPSAQIEGLTDIGEVDIGGVSHLGGTIVVVVQEN